jgi:hypothetical protein
MHEVPPFDTDEIRRRIAWKNDRVEGYHGHYCQLWLLLVHSDGNSSTWGFVTETVRRTTHASLFDRVVLCDLSRRHSQEFEAGDHLWPLTRR